MSNRPHPPRLPVYNMFYMFFTFYPLPSVNVYRRVWVEPVPQTDQCPGVIDHVVVTRPLPLTVDNMVSRLRRSS